MQSRPLLIIVSGLPAAGKTHLSELIAKELNLPRFGRDDISEILFDGLELEPKEWAGVHRRTSYMLLYWIMAKMLEARQSFVVESAFGAEQAKQ